MARFEEVYGRLGNFERILASGPMHHRLLWIHPFADGNGRVTRLMSYAVLRRALDTGGLWSIARGLAPILPIAISSAATISTDGGI